MRLNNYQVPNTSLRIRARLNIESQELSGDSSASDTAHKGIKPKVFTASFIVDQKEPDELTEFIRIVEQVSENGEPVVYEIQDATANAMNVRQVIFDGEVSVNEISSERAWQVSFGLREKFSVPEKVEERQAVNPIENAESPTTVPIASVDDSEEVELTSFEKVLQRVENAITPTPDNETA
ncbi:hypothetical protein LU351_05460 [Marinibactrum halimedae]|uniref:Uncharacterized protein n=2 Tax=Marinibactrum halimedae TaxID=1444977 RepID=A0AA37WMC9_9GAMM|nr:hypothetical protein [Marinibactrum halimedae]MCD9458453.1 hypothetical protein [Marinibactrum halimedae]GLS26150.1 hypothetical protein GCM10007877_18650 [Marinibactrum halimedae]